MGISYSTAKWLGPASFLYDFAAQQYGLLSSPNMKEIHDRNLSFWSPQPFFIGAFFFPQQLIQLAWLYRLWKLNPKKSEAERKELDQIVDFVPYYALGNICIGTWMFFWNSEQLKISNVFVVINTFAQLYYLVAKLPKMNTKSTSSILTHVVSKTFAGIGVLDILHNSSVAYAKGQSPSTLIKVLTGVGFGLGSVMSDWILGGCLVYDLVALAVGQSQYNAAGSDWSILLGAYAVGAAAIVAVKNYAIPPYEKRKPEYLITGQEEEDSAVSHPSNRNLAADKSGQPIYPSDTLATDVTNPVPGSAASNNNILENNSGDSAATRTKHVVVPPATSLPPPAPPPQDTEESRKESTPMTTTTSEKPKLQTRISNGFIRFVQHTKDAATHSWINVLLVFVPLGIAMQFALPPGPAKATVVFSVNAVAIVPLAGMLAYATESIASSMGDTVGALLNVTFGNAVELIVFIALAKNEIRIVQASILGSILSNLLLILGMAFLFGGLKYREQIYNSTITQMSACLLSLSVVSLLLPTAFHASFSDTADADVKVVKISRGTSVVLLVVYVLYLLFQLKSHAYMYESTPQAIIDEESHPGVLAMLGHSSSTESSASSSGSDSDESSGSHTTAKRIRRAFRNRRRRKSSFSSTTVTPSAPSIINSPTTETVRNFFDQDASVTVDRSDDNQVNRSSALPTIMSEDDLDRDVTLTRSNMKPRIRDFEAEKAEASDQGKRKATKKKNKNVQQRSRSGELSTPDIPKAENSKSTKQAQPNMDTEPGSGAGFSEGLQTASTPKRAFKLQRLSSRPAFRPALPKVLSNTVFYAPQHPRAVRNGPPPATGLDTSNAMKSSLRRTNSLPDRLNRPYTAPTMPSGPLPPYPTQVRVAKRINSANDSDQNPRMSRTSAVVLLLVSTGLVALCAEFLVNAIPDMIANSSVSQAFIGLIILPIVGNAAEHVTAVTVAAKNKMDLAIGVAVGSSIQIALFVTPLVVILGWIMNKEMSLYFNLFETVSLFVTAFVVNFLVLDGRSNYLEGALLIAAYVIIAVAAVFYPNNEAQQSALGVSKQ